jgi:hypothetical protein
MVAKPVSRASNDSHWPSQATAFCPNSTLQGRIELRGHLHVVARNAPGIVRN